ncbi:MAG: hypothetical protein ABT940_03570 [Alphaproteobacteria bacterium]
MKSPLEQIPEGYNKTFAPLIDRGLGLASSSAEAITPSRNTLNNVFLAMEAAGASQNGRTPLWVHLRDQDAQAELRRDTLAQQLLSRKDAIAQQQAQLEEQKRQNMFQQATGIFMNKDLPWSQKKKALMADQGNPYSRVYASIGDEKLAADFENVVQYLDKSDREAFQKNPDEFVRSVGGLAGVEVKLEMAKERQKVTAKETEVNRQMDELFARYSENPNSLTTMEFKRLNEHVTAQEERILKNKELNQRIKNLGLEGQQKQQEIARGKAPIVSPGYINPGGETEHIITDPSTGTQRVTAGVPMNRTQTQDLDPKFTPEQAARVSAMNMTLNNVADLRDKLVPDGKTVDRRVLFTSMFGGLPFTEGRDVERFIEDAIETKLRLQTGAAANKDEVKKEAAKFKPNQLDSDDTIVGKFDKLERYMQDTFNVLDPSGVVRARLGAAGGNIGSPPVPFDQAYEDIKKKRPNWSQKDIFRELQRRGVKPE